MRGPSRKVRDSSWRALHAEASAADEVSTSTKTATMEAAAAEVSTATKTATAEVASATTEVTATAAKSTSTVTATAKSTTTTTTAATATTVPSRRRGLTEGKQAEANHAKYCFCFHILSSR